ncbi:AraC family transcriptional regulator [Caulobacter sp. BP25]|uniref:helix-turn-helix transcriptional regulator n=1 Tax=Caulobacter sp. BP25 TaxID=2048900 RepID=UPI001374819F|nr:AraC family transcriptional regulator [Caulobacter sp. BP25]
MRLAIADFKAFEGEFQPHSYLMLNMCLGRTGHLRRVGARAQVEGMLRPGTIGLALPDDAARGCWPSARMLGVAVDLDALNARGAMDVKAEALVAAASQLHRDPLLSAVMTAMWRDAEAHGLSSAFFDHGLNLILTRLAQTLAAPIKPARKIAPLSKAQLSRVVDLLESRLATDFSVGEMARVLGMDPSTFTRAFRAATGLAPFAYLTRRRMELALDYLRCGHSVTNTAMAVGYANPSKFAAAFARVHGALPSHWEEID